MTAQNAARILIVEDDFIIAADLANQVVRLGYTVAGSVATSAEAVAAVRAQAPTLVLMDINLGGTIDGIAAANVIRQTCQVPVIFLSGSSDADTAKRVGLAGAAGVIKKPFTNHDLSTQIALALAGPSASA